MLTAGNVQIPTCLRACVPACVLAYVLACLLVCLSAAPLPLCYATFRVSPTKLPLCYATFRFSPTKITGRSSVLAFGNRGWEGGEKKRDMVEGRVLGGAVLDCIGEKVGSSETPWLKWT